MSVVASILLVLGLFALVAGIAWVAVLVDQTHLRGAVSRASGFDVSLRESRETQYAA